MAQDKPDCSAQEPAPPTSAATPLLVAMPSPVLLHNAALAIGFCSHPYIHPIAKSL